MAKHRIYAIIRVFFSIFLILKSYLISCISFVRSRLSIIPDSVDSRGRDLQNSVTILNVEIDNISQDKLLKTLDKGVVFTPNVDHVMRMQRDHQFFQNYMQADYRICDSQLLLLASKFLGKPLVEKISGSDFFPSFCEYHCDNTDVSIFLLGAAPGVAGVAQSKINSRIGRNIIVGSHSPSYSFINDERESLEIVGMINSAKASVLAIGVGAPKQEKWLSIYRDQMKSVKIFLAIGATIDFEAGHKSRAPRLVSNHGFEWLFRLFQEPRRLWRRYMVDDLPFFWLLIKQKLGVYTSPYLFSSNQKNRTPMLGRTTK